MANREKVKEMFKDLMMRLYAAKGFNSLSCDPLERNIFEAEMQEIWDEFDSHVVLYTDEREEYEEEIEDLEDQLAESRENERMLIERRDELLKLNEHYEEDIKDLEERNFDLKEENEKLWSRIQEISKVVNDTWN